MNKSMDRLSFLSNKYNVFNNTEEGVNSVISFLTDESRLIDTLTSVETLSIKLPSSSYAFIVGRSAPGRLTTPFLAI